MLPTAAGCTSAVQTLRQRSLATTSVLKPQAVARSADMRHASCIRLGAGSPRWSRGADPNSVRSRRTARRAVVAGAKHHQGAEHGRGDSQVPEHGAIASDQGVVVLARPPIVYLVSILAGFGLNAVWPARMMPSPSSR